MGGKTRVKLCVLSPGWLTATGTPLSSHTYTLTLIRIDQIKFEINPYIRAVSRVLFQDIFCGKFNKSMLNYAEVLNYDRHRALGHRIDQINQYFGENKGLL